MITARYKKQQLKYISSVIGCAPGALDHTLENLEKYYKPRSILKTDENGRTRTYGNGDYKKRQLCPSYGPLKTLQQKIDQRILQGISYPVHIQGSTKGRSNISNAKYHQGNHHVFLTDLYNFFPLITCKMIDDVFLSLGFSAFASSILTKLTTYNYSLPQGAPTSPRLSNLCAMPMDNAILNLCGSQGIAYTRYVDDLTFSSSREFSPMTEPILAIILSHGFKPNYRKTTYCYVPEITGIKVKKNGIYPIDKIISKLKSTRSKSASAMAYRSYIDRIEQTNVRGGRKKLIGIS